MPYAAHHSNHKRHCCCLPLPLPLLGLQRTEQCLQQPTGCKGVHQADAWGPPVGVSKAPKRQGAHLLGHAEGASPGALTPLGIPLGWILAPHVVAD